MVQFWLEWKWNVAAEAFRQAAIIDPSYPLAQRMIGIVASHQQRHVEAGQSMERLRTLEPLYAMNWALSAQVAFNAANYPGALQYAKQATVIAPDFWIGDYHIAMAAERLNQPRLALETVQRALAAGPGNSKLHALRGFVLATTGRPNEAREVVTTLTIAARTQYVPPYAVALIHAGLGDRDAAFEWLERAYQAHDVHLVALPTDAKWDPLRNDARFRALVARCGFMTPQS
jgi:tetratricopeptide (TPR) repeat protein